MLELSGRMGTGKSKSKGKPGGSASAGNPPLPRGSRRENPQRVQAELLRHMILRFMSLVLLERGSRQKGPLAKSRALIIHDPVRGPHYPVLEDFDVRDDVPQKGKPSGKRSAPAAPEGHD